MNNLKFIKKVAYQERIQRELHGEEHAKPYLRVLRIAAASGHVAGIFDDVIFDIFGLAQGGPFAVPKTIWKMVEVPNPEYREAA